MTDDQGRRWVVERVGRTSGTVATRASKRVVPGPADLIRFTCKSDSSVPTREVTVPVGLLERMSELEVKSLLENALGGSSSTRSES